MAGPKGRARNRKAAPERPAAAPAQAPEERVPAGGAPVPIEDPDALAALAPAVQGPRAKQFGLSDTTVVQLEPAYFPDGAEWLRSKVGLLLGIAADKKTIISYGPAAIPQVRISAVRVIVELAALELGTLAELRLIFLGADGKPLGIQAQGKLKCDNGPRCVFNIPVDSLSRIFTAAVEVAPSSAKRPILRTAWIEIDG